jgi:hypothetical protein
MKKLLALLALVVLALALPAAAPAKKGKRHHHHHRATVLKGSFRAVGADGAYSNGRFGKAQLVDNRRRDKLSVHLRRLAPRTLYTFTLFSVAKGQPRCEAGASGGTPETAFAPKSRRTNARGNLNAKRRSKTFRARRARRYFVLVSQGADPVACAKLDKRSTKGKGKGRGKGKARARGRAKEKGGRHGGGRARGKGPKG